MGGFKDISRFYTVVGAVKCDTAFGVSVNNGDARNPVCAISRARIKSASRQAPVI